MGDFKRKWKRQMQTSHLCQKSHPNSKCCDFVLYSDVNKGRLAWYRVEALNSDDSGKDNRFQRPTELALRALKLPETLMGDFSLLFFFFLK